MQADGGLTIERRSGTRAATTFRKLPNTSPGASATAARAKSILYPYVGGLIAVFELCVIPGVPVGMRELDWSHDVEMKSPSKIRLPPTAGPCRCEVASNSIAFVASSAPWNVESTSLRASPAGTCAAAPPAEPSGDGIKLVDSTFQGALYATKAIEFD